MRRTPAENINLPPALLSRFDIMWLILDRADMDSDLAMARHVLHVHQHSAPPALDFTPLDSATLRWASHVQIVISFQLQCSFPYFSSYDLGWRWDAISDIGLIWTVNCYFLRAYISSARQVVPYVPRDLTEYMASAYSALRQEEAQSDAPHSYTTARTLLSIIRLSEVHELVADTLLWLH